MSRFTRWLDRKAYPSLGENWDNVLFAECVLAAASPTATILDLGAGAGIVPQLDFRGKVGRVCGVDLDPRVTKNSFLDEGVVGLADAIPYPDETFDLVLSANVLEHLSDPVTSFREVARVLKPGGRFFTKSPSRWHYMPIIARMTSHGIHRVVNAWRGRQPEDTFPTFYAVNTRHALRAVAREAGLRVDAIRLIEGRPEYLRMNGMTYLAGIAYERVVNASEWLAPFRIVMIAEMTKPPA